MWYAGFTSYKIFKKPFISIKDNNPNKEEYSYPLLNKSYLP